MAFRWAIALVGLELGLAGAGQAAPAAPRPNMASAGEFSVLQFATTEPERLMADWNKPGAGVSIQSASKVRRNQPIVTFIVFTGCKADATGACNLTADFETYAPTGALYDRTMGTKIWVGHPAPPPRAVQLSEDALGVRIEDKDPLGTYTVRATITDHVAGVTLKTTGTFTAGE